MQAVIDKIMEAKSVAVLTHLNEDPDTIGSCFAFAKVMRKLGKEATVYVNGRIESRLAFIGDDYVLYQEGMKHNHDLCACIDCGDLGRIAERKSLFEEINHSINIDHHLTNTNFADANYVDGKAAAAGEILYALFEKWALNWIMILPRICIRQYAPIRVALSTVTLRLKQCVRRQTFWNMILTMRKWQDCFLTVSRLRRRN